MKLIASVCTFILVAALSVWLLFAQDPTDVMADGADISGEATVSGTVSGTGAGTETSSSSGASPISDGYAAAFVGLQRTFDVWRTQPAAVLTDPDLLAGALSEAQELADAEVVALAAKEKQEREQAAAEKRAAQEAARKQEQEQSRAVSPPPVSPPDYDDDWDDDDDDDDWDDDDWDD